MLEMFLSRIALNTLREFFLVGMFLVVTFLVINSLKNLLIKKFRVSFLLTKLNASANHRRHLFSERSWDFKKLLVFKETLLRSFNLVAIKLRTFNHSERWCSLLHF